MSVYWRSFSISAVKGRSRSAAWLLSAGGLGFSISPFTASRRLGHFFFFFLPLNFGVSLMSAFFSTLHC